MKYILILSLFTGLLSCSGYYHIKKANKHVIKAAQKGVLPERDTTIINVSDTTVQIDTVDNYIRITKTIRDTVYIEGQTVYIAKSRAEVRQDGRTSRAKIRKESRDNKQKAKTERKANKQAEKTKRKEKKRRPLWWFWFILGFCMCWGCGIIVQRIRKL